jgi:hypothetical protein
MSTTVTPKNDRTSTEFRNNGLVDGTAMADARRDLDAAVSGENPESLSLRAKSLPGGRLPSIHRAARARGRSVSQMSEDPLSVPGRAVEPCLHLMSLVKVASIVAGKGPHGLPTYLKVRTGRELAISLLQRTDPPLSASSKQGGWRGGPRRSWQQVVTEADDHRPCGGQTPQKGRRPVRR